MMHEAAIYAVIVVAFLVWLYVAGRRASRAAATLKARDEARHTAMLEAIAQIDADTHEAVTLLAFEARRAERKRA